MEVAFFCDIHEENQLFVNGLRATTFQLGDRVQIISQGMRIELVFSSENGTFFGHISRANRPSQISCRGDKRFEAYDWQISLRTIRRDLSCVIQVNFTTEITENTEYKKS